MIRQIEPDDLWVIKFCSDRRVSVPEFQCRTLWMFPRNKRTCYPYDVSMMLRALSNVVASKPHEPLNQTDQDSLTHQLRKLNIADGDGLRDLRSGGFRTYVSYLEQLGLIFKTPATSGGELIRFTLAGETMAELSNPVNELRWALARIQFPSPYSVSSNVNISTAVKVRPAVFLKQLWDSAELGGYLTLADIALACVYGRSHDPQWVDLVVSKSVRLRTLSGSSLADTKTAWYGLLDDPDKDLYTPRTTKKITNASEGTQFVWDIANTLANRLLSAGILIREAARATIFGRFEYRINPGAYELLDQVATEPVKLANGFSSESDWQRYLGRGSKNKDSRRSPVPRKYELVDPNELIKNLTMEKYREQGVLFDYNSFIETLSNRTGKRPSDISKLVDSVLPTMGSDLERQLCEAAIDGAENRAFETGIAALLRMNFPDSQTIHTGQKNNTNGLGGFADIFMHLDDHRCFIFDAKASKKAYALPSNDKRAMLDYALNSNALMLHEEDQIKAGIFVVGSVADGINKQLKSVSAAAKLPIGAVRIRDLITLVRNSQTSEQVFADLIENRNVGIWGDP